LRAGELLALKGKM